MTQHQSNRKTKVWNSIIILLSIIGLIVCITILFPQVRQMIIDFAAQMANKDASKYQIWREVLLSYALGGICLILFFDYCMLTDSGRLLVQKVKQEIKDCWSEIDFRSFLKPSIILSGVYFLGILTIVRANFLYKDDIGRAAEGYQGWLFWSRHASEILSVFIHADTVLTDISPLPQLLAILMLSLSSVFLVYIIANKKITIVGLLASIPLGLSPYFLECLSFKFDSPYMALSVLTSIFPFLFISRRKAFLFISVASLLIMCTTYQAASGIYIMIAVVLCFQYWNSREKTNKEILSFLGISVIAFCSTMLLYKFFILKAVDIESGGYAANSMLPLSHIVSGTLGNIKEYIMTINHDFGMIWKIVIVIVLLFFIIKSVYSSAQRKIFSFFISILIIVLSFILSFGLYSLLEAPLFDPRSLYGFGAFLAIVCVYISNYKKASIVTVLALNWCFMVFAFSYGNALADQNRYTNFRITLLLHDLSILYPNRNIEDIPIQFNNSVEFTPTIKNIAKHYPVIERLVHTQLGEKDYFAYVYLLRYFNWGYPRRQDVSLSEGYVDFREYDLPVVLDSYYHTIQNDGERILVILKH